MAKINFGGTEEDIITRDEFPLEKARDILKDETITVLGYGVQGPAQALNMKDNGFDVIIGQSEDFKRDWQRALDDGWEPGKTLFSVEEAAKKGTIIQYLISDAGQKLVWPQLKPCLNEGDALYFSHGFSIVSRAIPWCAACDHGSIFPLQFTAPAQNIALPIVSDGFR